LIAKTLFDIEANNRELLMILSGGDKVQYESYLDSDVVDFWGLVWEWEKRKARENKLNEQKARTDERN